MHLAKGAKHAAIELLNKARNEQAVIPDGDKPQRDRQAEMPNAPPLMSWRHGGDGASNNRN
jgi:hypothetical protein